jgi:hypothetical protein
MPELFSPAFLLQFIITEQHFIKPDVDFGKLTSQFCIRQTKPTYMNRYNLFHKIHKDLRTLLYDTGVLLQRTDFTIAAEAKEVLNRVQLVIALFDHYHHAEGTCILPAMMLYEPGVADAFEQDHEKAYRLGRKIEILVASFKKETLPSEQVAISSEVVAQFEEFSLFNILHMAREEQLANRLLWRYYTDAELQKMAGKIINSAEAILAVPYGKWMARSLNNEIVRWLKEMRNTAPEMEFRSLQKTAKDNLQPSRWNLVQDVLTAGTFIAN